MEKKYWKSLEELKIDYRPQENQGENLPDKNALAELFDDKTISSNSSRRDFLKLFGFTVTSAALAASCEMPVRKAIPYVIQPEQITPGKAQYYASTFFDGHDYSSILVKVRDGRPIKIEGNTLSSITHGGTNARTQASILNLYDDARYKHPAIDGKETSWEEINGKIINNLNSAKGKGEKVVLLTSGIISPSTRWVINDFLQAYPNIRHVVYDTISASGMLLANEKSFGEKIIPSYSIDKAELIVSFAADFLGTWLSPVEFTKQYVKNRKLENGQKKMSRHIQFEAGMSLTGSNADKRIQIKPSEEKIILGTLYNLIAAQTGNTTFNSEPCKINLTSLAKELILHKGKSLVVSGSNDTENQYLVNTINSMLGNYGNTIHIDQPFNHKQGIDKDMEILVKEMHEGKISGMIMYNVNPVYDYPQSELFIQGIKKVGFSVSMPVFTEETAELCNYICPDHYFLEAWNDAEFKKGQFSLCQPAIRPIYNTRAAQESFLRWTGKPDAYDEVIKTYWEKNMYPKSGATGFYDFWVQSLHDGIFEPDRSSASPQPKIELTGLSGIFSNIQSIDTGIEIQLYENVSVGNGKYANNPWLQELPDPVSKITWDNYAAVSPKFAEERSLETGDLISINKEFKLPVLIQPGQAYNTISIALGYGRTTSGIVAKDVGINVYPLVRTDNKNRQYYLTHSEVKKAGSGHQFAQTQSHFSMEGRPIIREASLEEYLNNPVSGNEMHEEVDKHNQTLYKEHQFPGHHWGMSVDLNSCVGCSACLIACSAENNVPVVGKKEVARNHEMHWIRIDRYYNGDVEDPAVVRQPVMCQHCDNAPCENVCPVAATNHSDEGINQMAYNRCIGTRYCNNNCPYKVRRFNWFDYTMADSIKNNTRDPEGMTLDLKRLVLNPDVTVRAKGVIEKCSFCIQRIQDKKLTAKLENRKLQDGEIIPACAQACPADAIVFGDLNDPESKISKHFSDSRNYHLLEELHTLPSVGYLTKIRNTSSES
ncbi:MAG: TAT-variant-translocated molybdopterin oxidoreductase [Bacteroidales bacterium]|nr:TAT-variant-translocated molybdopterin oxidoreductase [Bacteroidales bacterium]